jgi:hypothetical protein
MLRDQASIVRQIVCMFVQSWVLTWVQVCKSSAHKLAAEVRLDRNGIWHIARQIACIFEHCQTPNGLTCANHLHMVSHQKVAWGFSGPWNMLVFWSKTKTARPTTSFSAPCGEQGEVSYGQKWENEISVMIRTNVWYGRSRRFFSPY